MTALVEQFSQETAWPAASGFGFPPAPMMQPRLPTHQQMVGQTARAGMLTRLVEAEILPRLALARSGKVSAPAALPPAGAAPAGDAQTGQLVRILLTQEASEAIVFVEGFRLRGAGADALLLGLISHAARALGSLWDDDRVDFAQVSVALVRLQQVVRAISPQFQLGAVRRTSAERVLLLPAPGEQHTFGLIILAEFFRRAGWYVSSGTAASASDAPELVRGQWFDVAGFSVGTEVRIDVLTKCIRAVRRASRNRDLGVMVGGPLFLLRPDLVSRVGADAAASDATGAVRQACGLLALRAAAQ